jgi:CBS domain-containing protein
MLKIRSRRSRKTMGRPSPIALAPPAALAGAAGYVIWRRRSSPSAVGAPASGRRVTEAMTPNPRSIAPSATVGDAARLMRTEDVGSLPVVQDGRLIGMVTDRDIAMRAVAEGKDPQTTTVGEIASGELVTVQPEESMDEALRLMARHQVRRLPVVEQDRLVGIVAQADVALEAESERAADVVQQVSQPTSTPRS